MRVQTCLRAQPSGKGFPVRRIAHAASLAEIHGRIDKFDILFDALRPEIPFEDAYFYSSFASDVDPLISIVVLLEYCSVIQFLILPHAKAIWVSLRNLPNDPVEA